MRGILVWFIVGVLVAFVCETSMLYAKPDPAAEPEKVLRQLASNPDLVLSTDVNAPVRQFAFSVVVADSDEKSTTTEYTVHVAHTKKGDLILVRTADGLPFSYIATDLMIGFDPKGSGELFAIRDQRAVFKLLVEQDTLLFRVGFTNEIPRPVIILNFASLLEMGGRSRAITSADLGQTLRIETPNTVTTVKAGNAPEFPLRSWTLKAVGQRRQMSVTEITTDSAVQEPDYVDLERLRKAKISVHTSGPDAVKGYLPLPAAGYRRTTAELRVASELDQLLRSVAKERSGGKMD